MNDFSYENQGVNTYLVYEIGGDDEIDTMSLGMLTNNSIPGFAAATFTQMDTTKFIKYNVSAKVSVSQLFSGPVNKKRLVGVFSGIVDALLSAEDYMLDTDSILLDLDYIFADVSTCETVVICLPVANRERKIPELGLFFKNIIFNTQFDQTENCDHVAQILNYLNSTPVLALADFKELLEKIGKGSVPVQPVQQKVAPPEPARVSAPASTGVPATPAAVVKPVATPAPVQTNPKHENLKFGTNYTSAGQSSVQAKADKSSLPKAPQAAEEKPMSMFYLLQHYSKENAAIYKAQQEAKKAKKNSAPTPVQQPVQQKAASKPANTGFAVPGKPDAVNPGFAVPGQAAAPVVQQPVQTKAEVKNTQPAALQTAVPVYQQPAQPARPINFGETTVLGGAIGETTVLGTESNPTRVDPHLIRVKNNEKIPLNKQVFRIGKERSYVDYFIGDNTAISRSHANIVNHNGEFYVVDTNSTNHTYVNGGMIQSNVETKLSHGTKIRLANEDFEFRLY